LAPTIYTQSLEEYCGTYTTQPNYGRLHTDEVGKWTCHLGKHFDDKATKERDQVSGINIFHNERKKELHPLWI